jgi:tetratricopeptide (TPR) repeat protein
MWRTARLGWLVCMLHIAAADAHEGACKSEAPSETTLNAHAALEAAPDNLDRRISLADSLITDSCYDAALHVLEAGEPLHPRSGALQGKLREVRSLLSEQTYFDGLERAGETAKLSRHLLRCERLGDIAACDEALRVRPDDAQILVAKADALSQANRLAEALDIYTRARRNKTDDSTIAAKMAIVERKRQDLLNQCLSGAGTTALQACEAVLVRGSDDEFAIHKRKGMLLQSANEPAAALDAYIAANLLQQGDASVAHAIVTLSESTKRQDALTLAARGSALLSLDRPTEALNPLRQAMSLAPGLPNLKNQLADAEIKAKRKRALVATLNSTPTDQRLAENESQRRYSNAAPLTKSH